MAGFTREELLKKSKPKVNKSLIKRSKDPFSMKAVGFKETIKSMDIDPVKFIEDSFKDQVDFLKERIKANVPKGSLGTPLEKSIEVKVTRKQNKIKIEASSDLPYAVKVHEDPNAEGLPFKPTIEGSEGPKFISRVFEKHKDKIRDGALDAIAKGIGKNVDKNKPR